MAEDFADIHILFFKSQGSVDMNKGPADSI